MVEYQKVAKLSELDPGQTIVVDVDDQEVLLAHIEGEGIYAVANVCTHDGGPLDAGELEGHAVECPRHGARFDVRTGAVLRMPALEPVDSYPVQIDGDDIYIAVE